jgi:succinate dehydrogenase / fumarate reductase iron-sulfur subunit
MKISVFRFNPETDTKPRMQTFDVEERPGMMVREALLEIKKQDETFAFRHSCGEGVCGSDGMNINGKNQLACVTAVADLKHPIQVRPFPGRPVIRDLVVDMTQFYEQYRNVQPYLIRKGPLPEEEILQSPEDRDKLDGLYECIMCGCCSTACPSFGGTRISSTARRRCCNPGASSPIAAIKPRKSAWTRWKAPMRCSVAIPS